MVEEELITWSFLVVGLYFHLTFITIYSISLNSRLLMMCMSVFVLRHEYRSSMFANFWSLLLSGSISNYETNNACETVDFLESSGKMSAEQIQCMLCFRKRLIRQLVIFAFYCSPVWFSSCVCTMHEHLGNFGFLFYFLCVQIIFIAQSVKGHEDN